MLNQEKYKTTEERVNALNSWCLHTTCDRCNKPKNIGCCIYWLSLEAEEDKIEPCPYCGNKYLAITKDGNNLWSVSCTACLYESRHHENRDTAISAHNRVERAVRAAKEEMK